MEALALLHSQGGRYEEVRGESELRGEERQRGVHRVIADVSSVGRGAGCAHPRAAVAMSLPLARCSPHADALPTSVYACPYLQEVELLVHGGYNSTLSSSYACLS